MYFPRGLRYRSVFQLLKVLQKDKREKSYSLRDYHLQTKLDSTRNAKSSFKRERYVAFRGMLQLKIAHKTALRSITGG